MKGDFNAFCDTDPSPVTWMGEHPAHPAMDALAMDTAAR